MQTELVKISQIKTDIPSQGLRKQNTKKNKQTKYYILGEAGMVVMGCGKK